MLSGTDNIVQQYNDTLDDLMRQFRDQVDRDVAVFIHRAGKDSGTILSLYSFTPFQATLWISGISLMQRVHH
jgi:hypothetical protein